MAELRLIDANALIKGFEAAGLGDHSLIESVLAAGVYAGIENAPTIDAVEVVRCRECKESEQCPAVDGDCLYCNVWQTVVRCNGYCDHGAKKDGGAADGSE